MLDATLAPLATMWTCLGPATESAAQCGLWGPGPDLPRFLFVLRHWSTGSSLCPVDLVELSCQPQLLENFEVSVQVMLEQLTLLGLESHLLLNLAAKHIEFGSKRT